MSENQREFLDDEASESESRSNEIRSRVAGKYMTFKLADEEYGVEILKVRDINRLMQITRVPGTKTFIRGVINLRGKVIPVIDLRMKFGMGKIEETAWTVIIVVQYEFQGNELIMGLLVDEVLEVLDIAAKQIEPPPDFGTGSIETGFILGVGKAGNRAIFLLDIGKVLTSEETDAIAHSMISSRESVMEASA